MTLKKYFWPVIGAVTIAVSAWLLYKELRGESNKLCLFFYAVFIKKRNLLRCHIPIIAVF